MEPRDHAEGDHQSKAVVREFEAMNVGLAELDGPTQAIPGQRAARHLQHLGRRIYSHDLEPAPCQVDGEKTRATPDLEDGAALRKPQIIDHRERRPLTILEDDADGVFSLIQVVPVAGCVPEMRPHLDGLPELIRDPQATYDAFWARAFGANAGRASPSRRRSTNMAASSMMPGDILE